MNTLITSFFTPKRIIFISAGIIALAISRALGKAIQKDILKKTLPKGYSTLFIPLAASIVKYLFLVMGILAFAGALGINIGRIIQVIGLLGFGLSFILKDVLADIVFGFFILLYKPFHHGHELTVTFIGGFYKGKVVSVDLHYTTLENRDERILIPNSFLFKQPITIMGLSEQPTTLENTQNNKSGVTL